MTKHGFLLWSFGPLEDSLAKGVPVLVNQRWLPSCFPHSWCRYRCACARKMSSSAPSRMTTPGVMNLGFTAFLDVVSFSRSPIFTAAQVSTARNNLKPSIILRRFFFSKPGAILTGLSPSFCWLAKMLDRTSQIVTHSLRCRVCPKHFGISVVAVISYDQDQVRDPPIVLAATSSTPPIAILLLLDAVAVPRRDHQMLSSSAKQ